MIHPIAGEVTDELCNGRLVHDGRCAVRVPPTTRRIEKRAHGSPGITPRRIRPVGQSVDWRRGGVLAGKIA